MRKAFSSPGRTAVPFRSFLRAVLSGLILLAAGCASGEVGVERVTPRQRFEYSSSMMQGGDGLMPASVNVRMAFRVFPPSGLVYCMLSPGSR